jgi:hypothetical protein
MKTGRDVHVSKTMQMRQNYMRYINTLDYDPTIDERLDFKETSQGGEDLTIAETHKKRPINVSDKIKDHLTSNWIVWLLTVLAAGILYLIYDSKVAFTRYETMMTTHNEKIEGLRDIDTDLQKNDRSQDLKIQENRLLLEQIKKDVDQTEKKIEKVMNSQQHFEEGPGKTGRF